MEEKNILETKQEPTETEVIYCEPLKIKNLIDNDNNHERGKVGIDESAKDEENQFLCPDCNIGFDSRRKMKHHVELEHILSAKKTKLSKEPKLTNQNQESVLCDVSLRIWELTENLELLFQSIAENHSRANITWRSI